MSIEVYTLRHGDDLHHSVWREVERREGGVYQFNKEKWRELALSLAEAPPDSRAMPAEVFLCLSEDYLVGSHNRKLLSELLNVAARYSWGAYIYLVIDDRISVRLWNNPNPHGLRDWVTMALASGGTDLLELRFDRKGVEPVNGKLLRHIADRSLARQESVRGMLADGDWKCYILGGSGKLLDDFALPAKKLKQVEKFVIVFDKDVSEARIPFLKRAHREYRQAKQVVALCGQPRARMTQVTTSDVSDVYQYCRDEELEIVHCGGTFELLYFLSRLKKEYENNLLPEIGFASAVSERKDGGNGGDQFFRPDRAGGVPLVLLTSCFDNEGDRLEASHDAGEIRKIVPADADYRIRPSLESHLLPEVLREVLDGTATSDDKRVLAAWLYLGHGEGIRGLQSGSGKAMENADGWLNRFSAYQGALPLVFLAACKSDLVARRFAEAGAGVAIGFAGKVLPKACRLLVRPVISALLRAWRSQAVSLQDVILDAYEKGYRNLKASDLSQAQPIAFYQNTEVRICR